MSETALAVITEMGMMPISSPPTMLTGKIKNSLDLVSIFANDSGDQRRFSVVWDAALVMKMSPQDMENNIQAAIAMASTMDTVAGWKAPDGAKGQDKYGPKRMTMNARASEIRQLFGALLFTEAAKSRVIGREDGFTKGVKTARQALKDCGIQWDGSPAKTEAQRHGERSQKLVNDVRSEWMSSHPQQEGESMGDYATRMAMAVEILTVEKAMALEKKAVVNVANKLMEKYGFEMAAEVAEKVIEMYNRALDNSANIYFEE